MKTKHLFILFLFLLALTTTSLFYYFSKNIGVIAQFTDNVLRPVLGNKVVGLMEKTYFNSSDKFSIILNKNINITNDESQWKKITNEISYKKVKPDPLRQFSIVTLAKIKMAGLKLGAVAGTKEPGGPIGNKGEGKIPVQIDKTKLIAAFDGGFQYRDGEYGMIVNNKTYVPLKIDVGTIVGFNDGRIQITDYQGQNFGSNVDFIRQNCPILIKDGQIFAENEYNKSLWGRTFNSDIFTWRSGLGIDSDNNLIYAVGNNLSPETLAKSLQLGGAVNAIQLDINPYWVRFNLFNPDRTLTRDLKDGSKDYLNGYSKDFFYIFRV